MAGILRSEKGGVTVQSAVGGGTAFRVFLPVAEQVVEKVSNESGADERATILVVDDEPSVRDLISAVLQRKGYRVLLAADGREGLHLLEAERERIRAVVLDVVMPVMGASDALPQMKLVNPAVKVLLTSGYSESEAKRLCAVYAEARFIQKPYTAQQIERAVEELLRDQS